MKVRGQDPSTHYSELFGQAVPLATKGDLSCKQSSALRLVPLFLRLGDLSVERVNLCLQSSRQQFLAPCVLICLNELITCFLHLVVRRLFALTVT